MHKSIFAMALGAAACAGMPIHAAPTSDAEQIRQVLKRGCTTFASGDRSGATAPFLNSSQFLVYDFSPPRQKDYAEHKKEVDGFPEMMSGPVVCEYLEINPVLLSPDAAYSTARMRFAGTFKDGRKIDVTFRSTDVWRKVGGAWKIVHEHNSFPVDPFTGKADLASTQPGH